MLRARPALALLALPLLVGACAPTSGTKDTARNFRGDQRAVATAVEDLESAATKGDQDRICRTLLAPDLVRRLSSPARGCPASVELALKNSDTFSLDVQAVRINGNTATARVKVENGSHDRFATIGLSRPRASAGWQIARLPLTQTAGR